MSLDLAARTGCRPVAGRCQILWHVGACHPWLPALPFRGWYLDLAVTRGATFVLGLDAAWSTWSAMAYRHDRTGD